MGINPEICSPLYTKENGYSCYTPNHLYQLKQKYNRTHKKKIKTNDPLNIWKELNAKITTCKKESCWAKELQVHVQDIFAPKSPESWKKNENEWLSTTDISAVLIQYEKAYPAFKFIGPCASDYYFRENGQCVSPELCNLNVNTERHKYIGVVFNLDEHDKGGSHWVSLFTDLKEGQVYFSDSYGTKPEKRIIEFMKRIENYLVNDRNITKPDVRYNRTQHQKGNSECGVYSINFILRLLKGKTFDHITRKRVTDEKVNKCRQVYFKKP